MGTNINPSFNFNLNFNPVKLKPGSAFVVPLKLPVGMTPDGSIFNMPVENSPITDQNSNINTNQNTFEIPVNEFLADNNLSNIEPANVQSVGFNTMSPDLMALSDIGFVSTLDVTYNQNLVDGSVLTEHYSKDDPSKLLATTTQTENSISSVLFNVDGLQIQTTLLEDGVKTIQNFDPLSQRVTEETVIQNDTKMVTKFDEQGNSLGTVETKGAIVKEFSPTGEITKKIVDKGSGGVYTTEYSYDSSGNSTQTTTGPLGDVSTTVLNSQGNAISQTIIGENGQSHSIEYDGNGNTKLTVQNGETISQIAKQFNCSVNDLKNMNRTYGSNGNEYFQAGQSIVVPGEINADDSRVINRDSKEIANAKYAETEAKILESAQNNNEEIDLDSIIKAQKRELAMSEGSDIANALFEDIDGFGTSSTFGEHLNMIDSNNIVETLNSYKAKSGGEGLITAIQGEAFAGIIADSNPYEQIASKLTERAKDSGVSDAVINKFAAEFKNVTVGVVDAEKLENAVKVLSGEIISKEMDSASLNETDAMQTLASVWGSNVSQGKEMFEQAREFDSNIGKATDAVLGFFGCTSIDDMREKLNLDTKTAQKLQDASKNNDIDAFKSVYKEIFNRDFDPKLVASYDNATNQYELAKQYQDMSSKISGVIEFFDNTMRTDALAKDSLPGLMSKENERTTDGFNSFAKNMFKEQLGVTDEQYNELLKKNNGDARALLNNLKTSYDKLQKDITGGASLDVLEQNISNMESAMFGGNNVVADVLKFNKNQMITEVAGSFVADVAVSAALSMIPGGQAIAAVKLAGTSAKIAKLAIKAPKLVKMYNTASKMVNSSKTISKGVKMAGKVANTVRKDVMREEVLSFVHDSDANEAQLFENSATNNSIKMGVNYLAKKLGIKSKTIEMCVTNAIQLGAGTSTPETTFFKSVLGTTKISPAQQKVLAKYLGISYEKFVANA